MSTSALREAVAAYGSARASARWHVRIRNILSRLTDVEKLLPRRGEILDVGCGHGLVSRYLAIASPDRRVLGIDLDASKIDAARSVAPDPRVRFEVGDACHPPAGPFDAAVIVDVFYLLPRSAQAEALAGIRSVLRPDGVLVWKTQQTRPAWKYAITFAQEWVSTRAGLTMGASLTFLSREDAIAMLERAGFGTVEVVEMPWRLYSDVIYVARP